MLKKHTIMIEQKVNDEDHYHNIFLIDRNESSTDALVSGSWRVSDQGYNDKEPVFTSDNPQYWYWEWRGPHSGSIQIGTKMGRASHKEGEDEIFQVLITLRNARRTAGSRFEPITTITDPKTDQKIGSGFLTYNAGNDYVKGEILWRVLSY